MKQGHGVGAKASAQVDRAASVLGGVRFENTWEIECFDKDGNLKWREKAKNLIVNVGLNDILDKYYKGSSYSASFSVGLTQGSPSPAAGDTMGSHGGWDEHTQYSEGNRQALTLGTVSSQSVDNSASKASFTISLGSPEQTTVGGAFLCTDNTKGGTSGTLVLVVAFTGGNKTVDTGDTVNVTVTLTAASA